MSNNSNVIEMGENSWSCLLYVTSFIWVFPMSNFVLPLMLWLLTKHKHGDIELHGKNLLNFQITWGLAVVALWLLLLFLPFNRYYFFFGFSLSVILPMIVVAIATMFIVVGGVMAYRGNMYQFPLTYQFIK